MVPSISHQLLLVGHQIKMYFLVSEFYKLWIKTKCLPRTLNYVKTSLPSSHQVVKLQGEETSSVFVLQKSIFPFKVLFAWEIYGEPAVINLSKRKEDINDLVIAANNRPVNPYTSHIASTRTKDEKHYVSSPNTGVYCSASRKEFDIYKDWSNSLLKRSTYTPYVKCQSFPSKNWIFNIFKTITFS